MIELQRLSAKKKLLAKKNASDTANANLKAKQDELDVILKR